MAASASASASAVEVESMMAKVALDCGGDISSSQEDILARSSFLGGLQDQEEELFTTSPLTQQDPITMCTLPFTQSPPPSPAPSSGHDDIALVKPRRKPRVCTRKVRGAKIRTPTPSPKQQQQQQDVDPLYTAVLMIPTTTTTTNKQSPVEDFLALARQRGLL